MLRTIIVVIATVLCIGRSYANDSLSLKLLRLEEKAFYAVNDSSRNEFVLEKFDLRLRHELIDDGTFEEGQRLSVAYLPNSERARVLWNKAVLSVILKKPSFAIQHFIDYSALTQDSTPSSLLLEMLVYYETDSNSVRRAFHNLLSVDTSLTELACLNNLSSVKPSARLAYLIASGIIPGSGMIAQGELIKGFTALLLNAGMATAITALVINDLRLNAIAWGLTYGLKFYAGNLKLTNTIVDRRMNEKKSLHADECRQAFHEAMKKYPVSFR